MKYSLPGNPNNSSMNIEHENPIDFYKMVRANSYNMPNFNTIEPTSFSESIRKPLADPKGNVTNPINTVKASNTENYPNIAPVTEINTPNALTKPKTTFPTNQVSYIPNKPQSIYNNFSNATKITSKETAPYNINMVPIQESENVNYPAPQNITNPSVNNINMVAAELNQSVYHTPIGVPLMPLYGYDNCEDADKDYDYMKQMYPLVAKKLFHEIEEECDKLEYEGSCMFDEYPDKIYLGRIIDRIHDKCKHLMEDSVSAEQFNFDRDFDRRDDRRFDRRDDRRFDRHDDRRDDRHDDRRFDRHDNRFRDLIEVLFFNEMLNRRRRFRGRRRWY
jgi:hypothetical protein